MFVVVVVLEKLDKAFILKTLRYGMSNGRC